MSYKAGEVYETPDVELPKVIPPKDIEDENLIVESQSKRDGYTNLVNMSIKNSGRYEGYSETKDLYEKYLQIMNDFAKLTEQVNQYSVNGQSLIGSTNVINYVEKVNSEANVALNTNTTEFDTIKDTIESVKHDPEASQNVRYEVFATTSFDPNILVLRKLNDRIQQLEKVMGIFESIFNKSTHLEESLFSMEAHMDLVDDPTLKALKNLLVALNREIPLSSSFLSQNFGLSEEEENIIQYTEENLNKIKSFVEDVTILIEKIHHDEYKYQQIASISKRMFILLQKQKQTLTVMQRDQELLTKLDKSFETALETMDKNLETIKQRLGH